MTKQNDMTAPAEPLLTADAVTALFIYCLLKDDEPKEGAILGECIRGQFAMHPGRVAERSEEIGLLLAELPDEFQANGGGGWTFLNACIDRHGNRWTDMQTTMDFLFCLGFAAGKARWLLDRAMWRAFPGGMPYVSVN